MNRNNGAQSSCILLTMIISGCQHCWLWGFKIFPVPTQTSLLFPSFPSANRTQAALHYREACPLVFHESFTDFYNLVCAYRHAASFLKDFVDLRSKHLEKDMDLAAERAPYASCCNVCLSNPEDDSLCSVQPVAKHFCWIGHFKASRKPLAMKPYCTSPHHIPWANPAPCLFFPTYSISRSLNLHFEVSGFEQCQNLSWNLTPPWQPLPRSLSMLGGTICGAWGFEPAVSQVSHASLSTTLSSQL